MGNRVEKTETLLGNMSNCDGIVFGAAERQSSMEHTSQPTTWQLFASPLEGSVKPTTPLPSFTIWAGFAKSAFDTQACTRTSIRLHSRSAGERPYFQ